MTDCIDDNTLVEFVEGLLSPATTAEVESHLCRCVPCRRRVIALGASPSRIAAAPPAPTGIGAHLTLRPGTHVDRFVVRHEIGRGGMGVVFAARDPQLERDVALKLLHSASMRIERAPLAQQRLLDEARAMARLDHPNIITVYEAGTFCRETYIVMELVPGETLNQWLSRWNRPWASILDGFKQAGRALAHAHEHGLAHGDFKPENVLVDEYDRVRVTDFGLSRWFEIEAREVIDGSPIEKPATVMGTPRYMAPEQFAGNLADARSDQFGFCVALYEALYGRHPFAHDTALSVLKLSREDALSPMCEDAQSGEIPAWLHHALLKGLAPNPRKRYPSMRDLLDALRPPVKRRSRSRLTALTTAAMIVVCLIGYALGVWQAAPPLAIVPNDRTAGPSHSIEATAGPSRSIEATAGPSRSIEATPPRGAAGPSPRLAANDALDALSSPSVWSPAIGPRRSRVTADDQPIPRYAPSTIANPLVTGIVRTVHDLVDGEIGRVEKRLAFLHQVRDALAEHADDGLVVLAPDADDADLHPDVHPDEPRGERQTRKNGLGEAVIERSIGPRRRDLEVCFGEWRERQPYGRHALVVSVHIDREGRAVVGRQRGLRDKVVRKCVAGALEAVRFPGARSTTSVDLVFRSRGNQLRMKAKLVR